MQQEPITDSGFSGADSINIAGFNIDGTVDPETALHSFVQHLPTMYRLVANLCCIEKYKKEDAWKRLGISAATGDLLLIEVIKLLGTTVVIM